MTPRPDDDALSWDGDDDPTLDTGVPASASAPAAAGAAPAQGDAAAAPADGSTAAEPDASAGVQPTTADVAAALAIGPATRTSMGSTALIGFGVLVGCYALFTLGWVVGGLRLQARLASTVPDYMLLGSSWLVVFAPALWFGTVVLLTRRSPGWVRMLWLIAGVILLVPWPFIMVGPVAQ